MKKIGLLGAMDRNNYGDLLFPIVIEKWLSEKKTNLSFNYYGMKKSDLSKYGALKTENIKKAYSDQNDALIVVGGATLDADWRMTYAYLSESQFKLFMFKVYYKLFGNEKANDFARKQLHGKTTFPWIIPKSELSSTKIIYTSLSGTNFSRFSNEDKSKLANELNQGDYLSVRDPQTKHNLEKMGVKSVNLYPDSAIIMSKLFPQSKLIKLINSETKDIVASKSNGYICFQIGKYYGVENEEIIANELMNIAKETKMDVVLLPIGRAAMHEDIQPLNKIKSIIEERVNVSIPKDNGIYDTMYLISQSKVFIGTSLHGNITALSYGVPCVALNKDITKLSEFMKCFSVDEQEHSVELNNIASSVNRALRIPREKLKNNADILISRVEENFENVYKVINS